ncbi:hypothetical protein EDD58_101649 [Hazenella coriacea]|uniref:Uncharacterized protein n=1 Tax=Hazenella coriacea TaxID=1179467 RepID=A0A4R3LBA4_9BACL|nr:hypothetical protein EDD58_101649 [Hazenella coriacea]
MKKLFSFVIATLVFSTVFAASLGQVDSHQVASDTYINASSSEPGGL